MKRITTKMVVVVSLLGPLLGLVLLYACVMAMQSKQLPMRTQSDYMRALNAGIEQFEIAAAIDEHLQAKRHFITYFWSNEQIWNSNGFLHERYILKYQQPCQWVDDEEVFAADGLPVLMLWEVNSVEPQSDGRYRVKYGKSWSIEGDDLVHVLNGELTYKDIGIILQTDSPVEHFSLLERSE